MIGLCIEVSPAGALFSIEGQQPAPGFKYYLEDATSGTGAQNKAFHALLNAFWYWMNRTDSFVFEDADRVINFRTPSAMDFREFFKYKHGAGFSHVEFVNDKMGMERVKTLEEVPQYALDDFNSGNRARVKGVLKSWSEYTKRERRLTIDNLFWAVSISKCDDKKVHEIMDGMQSPEAKVQNVFGGEVVDQ